MKAVRINKPYDLEIVDLEEIQIKDNDDVKIKIKILFGLIGCLVGSIAYRIILAVAIKSDFFPAYAMKLISAVVVVLALALPAWQNYRANQKLRKGDAHAGTE